MSDILGLSDSDELSIIQTIYHQNSDQLQSQLRHVLVIRGWAITLFTATLGALALSKEPVVGLIGVLPLAMFWFMEAVYDSYRLRFALRNREIEQHLLRAIVAMIETKRELPSVVSRLFPMAHIGDDIPISDGESLRRAITAKSRCIVYTSMFAILAVSSLLLYVI